MLEKVSRIHETYLMDQQPIIYSIFKTELIPIRIQIFRNDNVQSMVRKVSPAKQLLIQQVGFVNSRHFLQHRSRAKH